MFKRHTNSSTPRTGERNMRKALTAALVAAGLAATQTQAATLYWDVDGATAGFAGNIVNGNWSSSLWGTSAAGDAATGNWTAGGIAYLNHIGNTPGVNFTISNDTGAAVSLGGIQVARFPATGTTRTITLSGAHGYTFTPGATITTGTGANLNFSGVKLTGDVSFSTGAGTVEFADSANTEYDGTFTIGSGRTLIIRRTLAFNAAGNVVNDGTLSMAGNVDIRSLAGSNPAANINPGNIGNVRTLRVLQSTETTYAGGFTPNNQLTGGTPANHIGSLAMEGSGLLRLTGNLTHDGGLTVNNSSGTLLLNGTWVQDANNTSSGIVDPGAQANLQVTSGTFGGTGSVTLANARKAVVGANGTIAPGEVVSSVSTIGMLTINDDVDLGGTAAFQIDDVLDTRDRLVGVNALLYGGTLNVTNLGAGTGFFDGQVFDLFDFTTQSGTFTTINLPTLPGLFQWKDFGGQTFDYTTGQIVVELIPEPASLALVALGGLLMPPRRRNAR